MKKSLIFAILFIVLILFTTTAVALENVNVILDGEKLTFDVPARTIDGRTMVPMRAIFEELGMAVEWFDETQTVMAAKQGVVVEFPIGSTTVSRNTVEQTIDVPAQIINGRTLVPVRFVSEFTGAEVIWEESTNTVFINSTDNIKRLDWNDTFDYWGEVENGEATGYGALYRKDDDSLRQIGKYLDSQIMVGTDFFTNGDIFTGNYENGDLAYGSLYFSNGDSFIGEFKNSEMSNGTYYFPDGEYYVGEFENDKFSNGTTYFTNGDSYTGNYSNGKRHGSGIYYYKDGSYLNVNWANGLADGYGIYYDSVENMQAEGNYTNDKRNGTFLIKDFDLNETYYVTYKDGVYIDERELQKQKQLDAIEKQTAELAQAYEELDEWYQKEMEELYDYAMNGDPFSTDWAKDIYEAYDVYELEASTNALANGASSNGGNIDSFAAANALRQQNALYNRAKSNAEAAILDYNQTYITNWQELINSNYNQQKARLDSMKDSIYTEIELFEQMYQ